MRQGQQNRRNRGRGGRSNNRSNNPLSRNYESNGPEVKIKGSASHIAEKYMTLARDALSSGNTVTAENYYQHAEHYNRIIQAAQAKQEENAAAHATKSGAPKPGGRSNDRRPRSNPDTRPNPEARPNPDNSEAPAKSVEAAPIPGTGEQPAMNGNGAKDEQVEKPKRKPRPRRPKVAKTDAGESAKPKDSNLTA